MRIRRPTIWTQQGFTLFELLIVVAILGVIAAIVIPNVISFVGKGAIEAANAEAQNVQLAVGVYMQRNQITSFGGDVGPTTSTGPEGYLVNPGSLQATYTITNSKITAASKIANSEWGNLEYIVGSGWKHP